MVPVPDRERRLAAADAADRRTAAAAQRVREDAEVGSPQ